MRAGVLASTLVALAADVVVLAVGSAQPATPEHARKSDVIYGRKAGLALTMEVFVPASPNRFGVVWVVSSGGRSSREQTLEPSFERRIGPLLKHGYTVFAVIHGSAPAFHIQEFIGDVRRAVRFIRNSAMEFGIDARQLAIAGSSSGGAIALTVAMQTDGGNPDADNSVDRVSSRIQAVGCFFPPTDFLNFGRKSRTILELWRERGIMDPSFQFYDVDSRTGARTLITDQEKILQILRDVSPVTHVTPDDPPTIVIHGDADQAVPLQQSERLVDRLKEANVAARLIVREGMRHAWPGWESDGESIAQWFDSHLRANARR
jgi:acetyl esterase/lipase